MYMKNLTPKPVDNRLKYVSDQEKNTTINSFFHILFYYMYAKLMTIKSIRIDEKR